MESLATMAGAHPHCRLLIPALAWVAAIVLTAFVPALFVALALILALMPILAVSWLALQIRWPRIARTRRGLLRCWPVGALAIAPLRLRPVLLGALLHSVRPLLRALSGTLGADHHVFTRLVAIVL